MELDVVENSPVALDGKDVLADEEMFVAREAQHGVAGADTGQAGIGVHPDDRGLEGAAGLRVPAGVERRVERQAVVRDLDAGDLDRRGTGLRDIAGGLGHRLLGEETQAAVSTAWASESRSASDADRRLEWIMAMFSGRAIWAAKVSGVTPANSSASDTFMPTRRTRAS